MKNPFLKNLDHGEKQKEVGGRNEINCRKIPLKVEYPRIEYRNGGPEKICHIDLRSNE